MSVIQVTPKGKTKILSQTRKTPNDSKGKSSQKAKKKRLETKSDSEDYEEKELVDDKSDGETQMYYTNNHPFNCYYITITYSWDSNYEGYTRVTKGTLRKGTRG